MRCEAEASGCCIEEVGVKARKFMREQSVGEGVGLRGSGWIAGQESERQGAIKEVAKGEEDGGGIREGQRKKSGD